MPRPSREADLTERTLVLLKPDTICRGLAGQVLARFETAGLRLIALKMLLPERSFIAGHYPNTPEWIEGMGKKTLETYRERNIDPINEVGTDDPMKIGEMVKEWNIDYLSSGPVVACVIEGMHAIATVRKLCGNTMPLYADPGSIRATYSSASAVVANTLRRAVRNLVHASSTAEEAEYEIAHWFQVDEICPYRRVDEEALY